MKKPLLISLIALMVIATGAQAAGKTWKVSGADEFSKGRLEGLSVSSEGEIYLAPRMEKVSGMQANIVWDVAAAGKKLYIGTGAPAAVWVLGNGQATLLRQCKDKQVTSVLPLEDGSVLAATAPRGTIFRIGPDNEMTIHAEMPTPYVWDMAVGPDGNVLCATGPEGKLALLQEAGKFGVLFDSDEKNLTCLAVDRQDRVFVGTSGRGLVYQMHGAGSAEVVYDPEESEVRCILPGPDGELYVGTAQSTPQGGSGGGAPQGPQPRKPANNSVYRVMPGEGAVRLIRLPNTMVTSLALDAQGRVLAGTGEQGRLIAVEDHGGQTMVTQFESKVISAMAGGGDRPLYLATSDGGGLWRLEEGLAGSGTFTSSVFDAKYLSTWGRGWWEGSLPPKTGVKLSLRTGNSREPGDDWGKWTKPVTTPAGGPVNAGPGRFAQVRLNIESKAGDATPTVWELNVSYSQVNRRPAVQAIKIDGNDGSGSSGPSRQRPGQKKTQAERQIMWKAVDPNGDDLVFDLYYKEIKEKTWKELETGITEKPQFKWDTGRVPDGHYLLRLVASDRRSRGPDSASAEKITHPLLVDNTSPAVLGPNATRQEDGTYRIKGKVKDSYSVIEKIEVSHNSDEWQPVFASDGMLDSSTEEFTFVTDVLAKGEHVFVFAAEDQMGNVGSEKIVIEVK